MRIKRHQVLICTLIGLGFNIWLAQHCLLDHSPPFPFHVPLSAQQYWDRYADNSSAHGPAKFCHVSGAIGCDFLIIDASPADIGATPPPRMMITRAGFPMRTFEGMHSWGAVTPSNAWSIPIEPRDLNVAWVSVLPCRPLPLGLIFNTAFFGGLAWLAIFGPKQLHQRLRSERLGRMQRCHQCGYDLRGNLRQGCPECGWRRET